MLAHEAGDQSLEFLGIFAGMMVAWEAKPWDRRLREDVAFPSAVFGPVDFCEFSLFAAI